MTDAELGGLVDAFGQAEWNHGSYDGKTLMEHRTALLDAIAALREERDEARKDAFEVGYIQGHEATVEGRYNLVGATNDYLQGKD